MTDWREDHQRVNLDCLSRDIGWITDKTRAIVGYARLLSIPPIVNDAAEELGAAELLLADALVAIRQARRDLKNNVTPNLVAAE